ncbi:MAG TPA: anibiotic ABC transporter [Candidatus Limnocylindria bacterium]|nr:anibiotic ABC transporter [Candidatus Limnocylindria bacterium]
MHAFTGTWQLVRLALRRDRVKLSIIILTLSGVFYASVAQTIALYGKAEQQLTYVATTAPSVVSRVFGGPIDGPDIGAIVLNETFLFTALTVAFMSTLTVVRHTRQNEEFGRSDLIESGVVSRHASLTAALLVTVLANVLFAVLVALILIANDLPAAGSIGTGAAMGAVGITFAALAGVAAQMTDSARGANSFSALIIGVAFLLRAIGDSLGSLTRGGLAIQSAFPSWLSPIGWAQLVHPYTQGNWWIFGLFGGLFAGAVGLSVVLMAKRDIGMGMIATRLGPARAARNLLSPFGLAWRLQSGILRGWAVTIVVLGVTYGLVVKEFQDLLEENEVFQKALAELGGDANDAFLGVLIVFMGITIAGYAIQALLRMRSEEANGQLESVLGTSVSRTRWMLSHIGFTAMGVFVLSLLDALSMGVTYVLATGGSWSKLQEIAAATFTQSAAVFALAGFVIVLFSLLPRMAVPVAWGSFAACLLVLQLGVLLDLPQWIMNLSPFGHLPAMPAQAFRLAPFLWLCVASIALLSAGLAAFNRRDITTS